jgi:hypothetical protein
MKGRGIRVEVQVMKDDAVLVRAVAAALTNPARQFERRAVLREHFGNNSAAFKAFLAAAPIEGVRVNRRRQPRCVVKFLVDTNVISEIRIIAESANGEPIPPRRSSPAS